MANSALTMQLLAFTGALREAGRYLTWTIAGEEGTTSYELQRTLDTMQGFATIAKLNAKNTSLSYYSFFDEDFTGSRIYYYRLKINGSEDMTPFYSEAISVRQAVRIAAITIYPNPAANHLSVSLPQDAFNATVKIANSSGVMVRVITAQSGRLLHYDISALPAGAYFIQIVIDKEALSASFIKQ